MKSEQTQEKSVSFENLISSLGLSQVRRYPTEYRTACPFCQSENTDNPAFRIRLDASYFCFSCHNKGNNIKDLGEKIGKKIDDTEVKKISPQEPIDEKTKVAQALKIYNNARSLSKDQLSLWLERRCFNKTQIYNCLQSLDYISLGLRYSEYKKEKSLVVPIFSPIPGNGFRGIERINFEKDKRTNQKLSFDKKGLGKKDGFFFLPVKDSKATIITESLANAFVNAIMGFNSLVMFGIGNTKQLPDAVALLQKQGNTVYYFPDSLGISPEDESREAKNFMDVLKKSPGLLGVLWPSDVKKNYDVNDLLISIFQDNEKEYQEKENDFKSAFSEMIGNAFTYTGYFAEKNRLKAIEEIKAITPNATEKISILLALKDAARVKIISASTGLGKTTIACKYAADAINLVASNGLRKKTIACKYAADAINLGFSVTIFCSTLPEVESVAAILKGIIPEKEYGEIDLVVSKTIELEESQESVGKNKREIGKIAITTYAYLGFKGETNQAYSIAKSLIENRIVICDEVQELWHKSLVMYPLANNYLKHSDGETITYKEFTKCPKTARKGNCKGCKLAFKRDAATGNPKTRHFAKSINEKGFDSVETMLEMEIFKGCLDRENYIHILSNLCYRSLQEAEHTENDLDSLYIEQSCNYQTWIETLFKWLHNPHIRIEFPTIKSREETKPLDRKTISSLDETGINFPTQACSIPFLCGRSLLPFFQLFKAKQITFMSATIPSGLIKMVKELSRNLLQEDAKIFSIDEIPFKFNLTFLKTSKRFSLDKQAQIVKKLPDENIFVCTARKSESEPLYSELRRLGDVALYFRRDWEQTEEIKSENLEIIKTQKQGAIIRKIITYSRSAITRGANFPKVCFALIDCNQFIPLAALDQINPLLTKEEIKAFMIAEIKENLTQILGRFFRSEMQREEGKTLIDQRKIVVLLHGLPEAVQDFSIDERLLASCTEYRNDAFLSAIPKLEIESAIEAIRLSRNGEPVPDRREKDHDHVFEKAKAKGLNRIDSGERLLLTPDDMAKLNKAREEEREKEKADNIENKLKGLKQEGKSWNQAYNNLNLARLSKIERMRLKSLWKKL